MYQRIKKYFRVIRFSILGLILAGVIFVIAFFVFISSFMPGRDFPVDEIFTVEKGASGEEIANKLTEEGYIKAPWVFKVALLTVGNENGVIAGDYVFPYSVSAWDVARTFVRGEFGDVRIRVTILEGASREGIASVCGEVLPKFNKELFMALTQEKEGYLFPDTYYFFPSDTTADVIKAMEKRFEEIILDFEGDIEESGKSLHEIITMASIIEREAYGKRDSDIISGILWKRISIDMPLQVDASFAYLLGKGSSQLTKEDLKTDSPYNTYTNKGLPPGPIGNPGKVAIDAALHPQKTNYLYYLHSPDGTAYYATNFEGHKSNRRFLR
jgi:UPF0755 protein